MKVALNARLLYDPSLRGWNRYTVNLLAELPALGVELFLYTNRPLHDSHLARLPYGGYRLRTAPPMRYVLWEQRWLPRQCAADGIDLLHCPFNFGLPWSSPCKTVLTLHDAIEQVFYAPLAPWSLKCRPAALRSRFDHWAARTRAAHIITVSEHARQDLIERLHVPPEKLSVIHEAADCQFHQPPASCQRDAVCAKYGLRRRFVFYIGGWEQRKNIPWLLRAFSAAKLPHVDLVLAGGRDEQRGALSRRAAELGISDNLQLIGWVDDADLPALYAEAACFVYPSLYEGFGLQLCEAMAVGCPTLAANATCLPEVLGSGGETFDLAEPASLAGQLRRIVDDPEYRTELTRRALARSADFSWEHTAEQTVAVYRNVLAESKLTEVPA
jgi:glycosyltransferase involved in cell wall biosynthesis